LNEVYAIGKLRQEYIKVLAMRAYSTDLRQKIIDAYNSEGSFRNIAKRFSVSRSFVQKLVERYQDTGLVSALPHGD
jgi:putative transposase